MLDSETRRKKANLKIDAELAERARAAGIDASRVAEAALSRALVEVDREKLRAEITQDFRALEAYIDKHGDPRPGWLELRDGPDAT
jgi:post-segregation antitoxin (ccd killing protein)